MKDDRSVRSLENPPGDFIRLDPAALDEESGAKIRRLIEIIHSSPRTAVAFSGGVDSTFLLKVWLDEAGEPPLAVFVRSEVMPMREMREAAVLAEGLKASLVVLSLESLADPEFSANRPDRCYVCKKKIFRSIIEAARERGFPQVVDASNADDTRDYRPGMRALRELGVASPLEDAGLTKADIRALSRKMGLPTWDKPSMACLASRFPYGTVLTDKNLRRVEEGEDLLRDLGFSQYRVRYDGETARIEVLDTEIGRLLSSDVRPLVLERFKTLGFDYVTVDLQGYRTGSLNETLVKEPDEAADDK